MKRITQEYVTKPVAELLPHPRNPREGDVGAIHESILTNGWFGAIIQQKSTGFVLAGNHRLKALVAMDTDYEVPVIEVDCDDETALRILLADNRTNDLASYDSEELSGILAELAEAGDSLDGTGYSLEDLDDLIASLQEFTPFPKPDANVTRAEGSVLDRLERYQNAASRSIMLDYPLDEFRWIVDAFAKIREEMGVTSNSECVIRLLEDATGETCERD
jgi:hypothetical protein